MTNQTPNTTTDITLSINTVAVEIDGTSILNDISLSLEKGEIGCLLGPSGCGKTTLLRSIAGFIAIKNGEIRINQQKVSCAEQHINVEKRKVGMVFQDFALFPHLTVAENILFGLRNAADKKPSQAEQQQRLEQLLNLIELPNKKDAYPHELSGGQQQRIALARALAPKPSIILLDEPFSSIDRSMRDTLAFKVRQILKQENATAIMVTHDQAEAYAMADKIGIMNQGSLLQWQSPLSLYHQPNCDFVASFIGTSSFIKATCEQAGIFSTEIGDITYKNRTEKDAEVGESYRLLVRPDDIVYQADSLIKAKVLHSFFKSVTFIYLLELANGEQIYAQLGQKDAIQIGDTIGISVDMDHVVFF